MKRKVVVTGIGAITPLGNTAMDSWQAAKQGKCGIAPITHYDTTNQKAKLAAEVKGFDPEQYIDKREVRKMDRVTQFAIAASVQAMQDSGLDMTKEDASRCGVIVSSGIGGLATIELEHTKGLEKGFDRVSPYFIPMVITNMPAGNVAIRHGFQGMCSCPVTACASGTNAIGDGFRQIRDGYADIMMCGGTEASVTQLGMGGFTSLKALHTGTDPMRASIPFDAQRSGFVMGEGAGILILEEYEHAKARGAKIYAEIVGYASNCDAHHITAPAPQGEGAARCMTLALQDADLQPQDITYINAHGTSTPMNDACETAAIKTAFQDHANKLCVSSTKSMTGHLLGASGAVEAIFTLLAVHDNFIPATINYQTPDPDCDLDIVPNQGRNCTVKAAISNSLGFGGHNASLVFKKED